MLIDTLSKAQQAVLLASISADFSYKLDWGNRLKQLQYDYPQHQVLTSNPSHPYTQEECDTILKLKASGWTTQETANELKRTYWSVTYKFGQLKKAMERVHDL